MAYQVVHTMIAIKNIPKAGLYCQDTCKHIESVCHVNAQCLIVKIFIPNSATLHYGCASVTSSMYIKVETNQCLYTRHLGHDIGWNAGHFTTLQTKDQIICILAHYASRFNNQHSTAHNKPSTYHVKYWPASSYTQSRLSDVIVGSINFVLYQSQMVRC